MVLSCLVGLMTCLESGLEVLAVVVLAIEDFEGVTLDILVLDGTTLMEFVLGLVGVALDGVVFGLGDVFFAVVGCGFFGSTPCSEAESSFVLVGLLLLVAGIEGFFLLSVTAMVFLGMLGRVGFVGAGLEGFWFGAFGVEAFGFGGFVGGAFVLSGAVTVSVLALRGGEAKPSWTVTGITVGSRGVDIVPREGFIAWVEATYRTAEAAAAALLARLTRVGFLTV